MKSQYCGSKFDSQLVVSIAQAGCRHSAKHTTRDPRTLNMAYPMLMPEFVPERLATVLGRRPAGWMWALDGRRFATRPGAEGRGHGA